MLKKNDGFDALRKTDLKLREGRLHLFGELAGVKSLGLRHGHDHAIGRCFFGSLADGRITAHRLDAPSHLRHIGNQDRTFPRALDRCAPDGFQISCHGQISNHDFRCAGAQKTASTGVGSIRSGGLQFLQRDPVGLHAEGIWLDLHLPDSTSHIEHLSDAGNALKAAFDHPIG